MQAEALNKRMWALTEQHAAQVEELQAELRQQKQLYSQLQSTKSDALVQVKDMKEKLKQVREWQLHNWPVIPNRSTAAVFVATIVQDGAIAGVHCSTKLLNLCSP